MKTKNMKIDYLLIIENGQAYPTKIIDPKDIPPMHDEDSHQTVRQHKDFPHLHERGKV